ncbi:hypothetical protein P171DRAFT_483219 [Karstenula rhodostoma CBS 690.94]|uniref:Uncharacterized protein n=1 Tax=Karstenula rhodostoma CBS 690.94 TaxID=1392251 RepID=A0A9P4PMZ2_9PLEO|nr:hypothetical protein P171DRAFT_483219 [Karstenula rhodostoma CBS 690.94]
MSSETPQNAMELTAATLSNRPQQVPTKSSSDARALFSRWSSQMAARSRRLTNHIHPGINALQVDRPRTTADQVMLGRQMQGAADEESRLEYFPLYKMALIKESKHLPIYTQDKAMAKDADNVLVEIDDDEGLPRLERIALVREAFKERWPKTLPKTKNV